MVAVEGNKWKHSPAEGTAAETFFPSPDTGVLVLNGSGRDRERVSCGYARGVAFITVF